MLPLVTGSTVPQVRVDPVRRLVRFDRSTVGAATVLLVGDDTPIPAAAEPHLLALGRAGLLVRTPTSTGLVPWLAELLAVVLSAPLELRLGIFSAAGVGEHTWWVTEAAAVQADHHGDGTVSLFRIPASFVAATVATLVDLDPGRQGPTPAPVRVPPQAMQRFHECLRRRDAPGAASALTDDRSLRTEDLQLMLDLVEGRARSWQAAAGASVLSVVDGGTRGLWCSTALASVLELVPTTAGELWNRLIDLATGPAVDLAPPTSPSPVPNVARSRCPVSTAAPDPSCSSTTPTSPVSAASACGAERSEASPTS